MKKHLLRQALRKALKGRNKERYKHYCYIVQNNKIIGWGYNKTTNGAAVRGYPEGSKIHAEAAALNHARNKMGSPSKLGDITAINVRLNRMGEMRLSRPCDCCFSLLKNHGCVAVWFTTISGWGKM